MPELEVLHDRYDGGPLAERIETSRLLFRENEASLTLSLGDDEEFEICFESKNGKVEPELLSAAKSLMLVINQIDNQVQDACAAECRSSRHHPRNYESMLAYVRIYRDRALLRYFGTGVNTEWDELVRLDGSTWSYAGVAK